MNNRPWLALAPGVAAPLRPRVPTLVREVIDAVQSAVPAYSALDPAVSNGVHVALDGFLDLVEGGDETRLPGREVYERFGQAEARNGRSLDALLTRLPRRCPRRLARLRGGRAPRRRGPGGAVHAGRGDLRVHRRDLGRLRRGARAPAVARRARAAGAPAAAGRGAPTRAAATGRRACRPCVRGGLGAARAAGGAGVRRRRARGRGRAAHGLCAGRADRGHGLGACSRCLGARPPRRARARARRRVGRDRSRGDAWRCAALGAPGRAGARAGLRPRPDRGGRAPARPDPEPRRGARGRAGGAPPRPARRPAAADPRCASSRRSRRGSTPTARPARRPPRSTCTCRPSATASASCATCWATRSTTRSRGSSSRWLCGSRAGEGQSAAAAAAAAVWTSKPFQRVTRSCSSATEAISPRRRAWP